jgi:hypothetical protein
MAARLFGDVKLERPVALTPNCWNVPTADALLEALAEARPRLSASPSRNLVVTFGDQVEPGEWGIGGGD